MVFEDCNKILFILAGLPLAVDRLRDNHESSLRLFEEYELNPLKKEDVNFTIQCAVNEINNIINEEKDKITITDGALNDFHTYSEGYPHFLQQIGHSTIQNLLTNIIDENIVSKSMFDKGGALELIGRQYYYDLYYNKIGSDNYRQILTIMAEKWNTWISKEEIKKGFKGTESNLSSGIKVLRDRNIILSNPHKRGEYRLQWLSFAFWIKTHKLVR